MTLPVARTTWSDVLGYRRASHWNRYGGAVSVPEARSPFTRRPSRTAPDALASSLRRAQGSPAAGRTSTWTNVPIRGETAWTPFRFVNVQSPGYQSVNR